VLTRSFALSLPLLACLALPAHGDGQPYLALEPGTRWIYGPAAGAFDAVEGVLDTVIVTGLVDFDGIRVTEFRHSGANEGLLNYWSVDDNGSVLLHGYADAFGVARYIPPLIMLQCPVTAGSTWQSFARVDCVSGYCSASRVGLGATLTSIDTLSMPAGTFMAARVDDDEGGSALHHGSMPSSRSLLGTRVPSGRPSTNAMFVRWWAPDVGMVQRDTDVLLQFDHTTPTRTMSWGRLKMLYR
jgi:hypothetical protein